MTYLSDLEPSKVEETPFFGRRSAWRKDVNLAGGPLKMDGRTYERGLAVHSRSSLTYDLDGQYATFEATVGFDESAKGLGRVDCRVFADDKELYANPDLRADAPPVKLALPVAKAQRLKLVVDFGPDQDTGDRVIWANSRLFRSPPSAKAVDGARPGLPHRCEPNLPEPEYRERRMSRRTRIVSSRSLCLTIVHLSFALADCRGRMRGRRPTAASRRGL